MEKVGFQYRIVAHVTLSAKDVDCLIACAKLHYDGVCKAAGQLGGKFYGWKNLLNDEPAITVAIDARDIGLMKKTLEVGAYADQRLNLVPNNLQVLWAQITVLQNEISQESHRINRPFAENTLDNPPPMWYNPVSGG